MLISLDFTTLVANTIERLSGSDGSPYEKRVDAKGRVTSDRCIADEIPVKLPENWTWARLGSIVNIVSARRVHKSDWKTTGIPFYRAREIVRLSNGQQITDPLFISKELYEKLKQDGIPQPGDLMVTGVGTIGTAYIVKADDNFYYKDASVLCFENRFSISSEYLRLLMQTSYMINQVKQASSGTTVATITMKNAVNFFLPLPPLAEQRRIVERVGELMPLVEEYGELEDAREALDAALPGRLRKSVLQLAVQGGLAPQDPTDEPAGILLERIRGQRRQLVAEGKMRAPKGGESIIFAGSDGRRYEKRIDARGRESEPVCIEDEIPFEIPEGWEWARLSSVLQLSSGLGYKKDSLTVKSECMVRVLRGGNIGEGDEPLVRDSDVLISAEFVDESLLLRDGQIITPAVTSLENVGKAAIVRTADGNTVCGGFVFFLTPFLENPWHSEYLHRYLTSPAHIDFCRSVVKKSGQAFYNLSKSSLNLALIAVPPLAEQRRIANEVDRLFKILA